MANVPEQLPDGSQRAPRLQNLLQNLANEFGIEQEFIDASDHPGHCRCEKCLAWWSIMYDADPDNPDYGPFTKEEIEEYLEDQNE